MAKFRAQHEFLMHAILGFAATQLALMDASLVTPAMNHRVKAIKAIKKRLADAPKTTMAYEETNAMVAACFALTFQSVGFEDGMPEFMTFIRGIVVVGMQMMFKGIKPLFGNMMGQEQDSILSPVMEGLPLAQRGCVDSAVEGISNLRPICVEPLEMDYQNRLMGIAEKLYINSYDGESTKNLVKFLEATKLTRNPAYKTSSEHWAWWMFLPHGVFLDLINLNNQVILLLHTHWLALTEIMAFISQQEHTVRDKEESRDGMGKAIDPGFARWLKYFNARIDYEHQVYNQWPMWVEEQLDRDLSVFGKFR
jgi:hypothetical protein